MMLKIYKFITFFTFLIFLSACDSNFTFKDFDNEFERDSNYVVVVGRSTNAENGAVDEDYTYVYNNGEAFFMKHEDYFIINDDDTITAILWSSEGYFGVTTESFYNFLVPDLSSMENDIKDKEYEKKGSFPFTYYSYGNNEFSATLENRDYETLEYVYKSTESIKYYHFMNSITHEIPSYTEMSLDDYLIKDTTLSIDNNIISGVIDSCNVSIFLDEDYAVVVDGADSYHINYLPSTYIITKNDTESISLTTFNNTFDEDIFRAVIWTIYKDRNFIQIEELY